MRDLVTRKVVEICDHFQKIDDELLCQDVGLLTGGSGIILTLMNCGDVLNNEAYINKSLSLLQHVIRTVYRRTDNEPHFHNGLSGVGWLLSYIQKKDIVDLECDQILNHFDDILYEALRSNLEKGNYDLIHGALGQGMYFLSRETRRSLGILEEMVQTLKSLAISEAGKVCWKYPGESNDNLVIDLGLAHGISGILIFLCQVYHKGIAMELCTELISGTVNYLNGHRHSSSSGYGCFWPYRIVDGKSTGRSRLAWCYGDLGIAMALLKGNYALNDSAGTQLVVELLEVISLRKDRESNFLKDAGLCHGTMGIYLLYDKVYELTANQHFKVEADYWLAATLETDGYADGIAGFKMWSAEGNWVSNPNLLEGACGVSLAFAQALSESKAEWSECLFI